MVLAKRTALTLSLAPFALALAAADAAAQRARPSPLDMDLDLEMSGREWRELDERLGGLGSQAESDDPLQDILTLGKRNLDWLEAINAGRPADQKLELSTPATQRGIPITEPRESNRDIVQRDLAAEKAAMPAAMVDVLFGTSTLPSTPPAGVSDDVYLEHARLVDRIYQSASRWLLQEPWLDAYAERITSDVRGYYFLTREPDLDQKLTGWAQLDQATKDRLSALLIGLCRNAEKPLARCRSELDRSVQQSSSPKTFYDRYLPAGKSTWDGYFALQNPRPEAEWTSASPDTFKLPFEAPESSDVQTWLAENIEDEWRLGSWQLRLGFERDRTGLARVAFEAGATPHVNGLGGDVITMDANRSIQEYTTRWTIRHEFGHVLGLPDCYIEFYDAERGVMINYQIDVDNLMCSRRGHLLPLHIEELKRAYFRE